MATLLDLVITRQDEQLVKKYTIDREQFPKDHFMINCVLDIPKPSADKVTYTFRKYQLINHDEFSKDLKVRMHDIECCEFGDVNNLLSEYNLACSEVLDKHAPPVIKTRKVRYHPAWYDESVQNARRERRRCERKWRKSRTDIDYEQYRESKQKVSDQIRSAKTSYYDNKLNNCSVKDMFKTINELLHISNKAITDTQCLEDLAN